MLLDALLIINALEKAGALYAHGHAEPDRILC